MFKKCCTDFPNAATYGALLQKAKGDISALPIIATAITGPAGETVYRIDDIIGEVSFLSFVISCLVNGRRRVSSSTPSLLLFIMFSPRSILP